MKASREGIILLGGGGHARVLIDLIRLKGQFEIVGILDPLLKVRTKVGGVSVMGDDRLLPKMLKNGIRKAGIAVGTVGRSDIRKNLYQLATRMGFSFPPLIHPQAFLAENVRISSGVQVLAGAILQCGTRVGANTIINTGAMIDHDCQIGKHVHICPGTVLSGGCRVGDESFLGAGTVLIQGIKVGRTSVVAAGSVVVRDVPARAVVKGVPAGVGAERMERWR